MKSGQTTIILAAILAAGAGALAFAAPDHRDDSRRPHACTNETLKGTYGIQIQGTRPAPGGTIESVIGVVIRTYDGWGSFTQVSNVKGSISGWVPDRVGGGTYDVSEDCTAIVLTQPVPGTTVEERLVIVDGGRETRSATTMPLPVMVTGVARRTSED